MKSSFAASRKHLRVAWRVPVEIVDATTSDVRTGMTFNVSAGGMLAFVGAPLRTVGPVRVRFDLPVEGRSEHFDLEAEPLRGRQADEKIAALRFHEPAEDDVYRLRQATVTRVVAQMQAIGEFPAFWDLSELDLLALASVCHDLQLPAGAQVARFGDVASSVFIVKRGAVQLRAPDPKTQTTVDVEVARAGQVFGEVSALLGLPHNLDIVALEDTECLVMPRAALAYLREQHPNLTICLYEIFAAFMGRRVRKLTNKLVAPISY
ncbi:MAG: cyclic nucleotide-binding domain-containing protein [Planctomycetes bacterium]|nr:cyclic nucleotide-binding domain-containing protein [Planctomycetota bacterium]